MSFLFWVVLIGFIIFCVTSSKDQDQKLEEMAKEYRKNFIEKNKLGECVKYTYVSWPKHYMFIADEQKENVYLSLLRAGISSSDGPLVSRHESYSSEAFVEIPFKQIIGCEIKCDEQTVGGVGRAVVGGALFGDTGAIVGAVTAKKKRTSYSIIIYLTNIEKPKIEIWLTGNDTGKRFAENVFATIKAIVARTESEEKPINRQVNNNNKTVSEKIDELIHLRDSGVITEEEYDTMRKRVLSQF